MPSATELILAKKRSMHIYSHLELQPLCLKPEESWVNAANGIHFLFFKKGAGYCVCDAKKIPVIAGDVLIFTSRPQIKLQACEHDELLLDRFSVGLEHILPLFADQEMPLAQKVIDAFKKARHFSGSQETAERWHALAASISPPFNMKHRGQLINLAAMMLHDEFQNIRHPKSEIIAGSEQMLSRLEKLTLEDIRTMLVRELAMRFNCSPRQLNRFFQRYFGLSVRALRMEMRLLKAVSLLRNQEYKIINVAELCDFNHLGQFNTCFKRRFGVSPGNWRRRSIEVKLPSPETSLSDVRCLLCSQGVCPWGATSKKSKFLELHSALSH